MVTLADPGTGARVDVAVTVTEEGFGARGGAVYSPLALIVPFACPPVTAQVTA